MNKWQGTPRSGELGGKCDLESRRSAFPAHLGSRRQHINSPSIYECGIMRVLKEVVFFPQFYTWRQSSVVVSFSLIKPANLYGCNSYMDESNSILN